MQYGARRRERMSMIERVRARLSAVNLKPDPVAVMLHEVIGAGGHLFTQPDLRGSHAAS